MSESQSASEEFVGLSAVLHCLDALPEPEREEPGRSIKKNILRAVISSWSRLRGHICHRRLSTQKSCPAQEAQSWPRQGQKQKIELVHSSTEVQSHPETRVIPIVMEDNEAMSGSGLTELTATVSRASRKPEKIPVSSRDQDPIAMEGNEALGEPMLQPFVESPLNTLAEPLLDATAADLPAELLSADSAPDQYESESKVPRVNGDDQGSEVALRRKNWWMPYRVIKPSAIENTEFL
ncbi:hypothetical protein B0H14DRAFT_3157853 [Mycena olivaceomarginata]|nr:hypothetical protein B0H14DRAFT_3157853 [Mycena olivaceomarginata]